MLKETFLEDESGMELSEYALTGALITVGVVAAIALLSGTLTAAFQALLDRITG